MRINKVLIKATAASVLMSSMLVASVVLATDGPTNGLGLQYASDSLTKAGGGAGLTNVSSLPLIVGRIINIALSLLGIVFLVLSVYAGFKWMTAQGEEGPVEQAKDTLKNAVIGLVVVLAAYAISNFVVGALINATT